MPLDEPDQANALHCLTKWLSWTATDVTSTAVTMRLRLMPQDAYPFAPSCPCGTSSRRTA